MMNGNWFSRNSKRKKKSAFLSEEVEEFIRSSSYIFHLYDDLQKSQHKPLRSLCHLYIDLENPLSDEELKSNQKKSFHLYLAHSYGAKSWSTMLLIDKKTEKVGHKGEMRATSEFIKLSRKESQAIQCLGDKKSFLLSFKCYDSFLDIEIWFTQNCLKTCSLDDQPINSPQYSVVQVMAAMFGDAYSRLPKSSHYAYEPPLHHIEEVYRAVRAHHYEQDLSCEFQQPEYLLPELRTYQKRCVVWMLSREKQPATTSDPKGHPLWLFNDHLNLLYNPYGGYFIDYNDEKAELKDFPEPQGGILADEMGLGKTVEILALSLSHIRTDHKDQLAQLLNSRNKIDESLNPRVFQCSCGELGEVKNIKSKSLMRGMLTCSKCNSVQHRKCVNYDPMWNEYLYLCPQCWEDRPVSERLKSRATLIIAPQTLIHQWMDELLKRIDCNKLNVLHYEGVSSRYYYPYDLQDRDFVITSYETLRSDLKFVDIPCSERFRNPKRFHSFATPLKAINWWRICLDEAQMVESVTSQAAVMVSNLSAINRWGITGTPVQKSVNDLYGLIMFVGERPFNQQLWWYYLIAKPYFDLHFEPLIELLKKLFWRNNKKDVSAELGFTEKNDCLNRLDFAPIEAHFYKREKQRCNIAFNNTLSSIVDLNISLKKVDTRLCQKLMTPLITLRQACCHPQIVGNHFLSVSKKTMTMQEVLDSMIKRTTVECEEDHRKLISAINGQAGIALIRYEYQKAVNLYRAVLQSNEQYGGKVRTDKLQLYHTKHNLADLFDMIKTGNAYQIVNEETKELSNKALTMDDVGHTLRDESLRQEAEELKAGYLNASIASIIESRNQLNSIWSSISKKINLLKGVWWIDAIKIIVAREGEQTFLDKVRDTLQQHALKTIYEKGQIYDSIKNRKYARASGLQLLVSNMLDDLRKARDDLGKDVLQLSEMPSAKDFNEAVDCHLRAKSSDKGSQRSKRKKTVLKKCKYCMIHESFNLYEGVLFFFANDKLFEDSGDLEEILDNDRELVEQDESINLLVKQRRGNWSDSELEQTLKTILSNFSRISNDRQIIDEGRDVIDLFTGMKKEFKSLRAVWINIFDYISRMDELNMATYRLRLRFADEPETSESSKYILSEHEIEASFYSLRDEEKISRHDLNKNLAHLNYLSNLKGASSSDLYSSEPCPICTVPLGAQRSVFSCTHLFCLKCTEILVEKYSSNMCDRPSVKCPICRQSTATSEIVFIDSGSSGEEEGNEKIKVVGSWSTKVEEIVRTIFKIKISEPDAKCLVFSSWTSFLILLSEAFDANSIKYRRPTTKRKLTESLDSFKSDRDIDVLLIPFSYGSKGLNIVEANHIILVEPLLEPAQEYQAIGRIHRIGQTKSIFVHKFIIKNTVEERINELFSIQCGFLNYSDLQSDQRAVKTIKDIKDIMFSA
ncbi:E3 ubiquitin-protein ligase SHPRH-like [Brevipalpus obovatus]|uniref:E3 ubiquitin-protein ligase SHPRH-like n=1 Tax=Brevipalpus obovatus TaxID=246614 RepID=UPI003D9E922E